jgi:putative ABC transport system ATP-binding protein
MSESGASAPTSFAVSMRGVTKTFGAGDSQVQALKGVNLDARCGEMLMIVGPSGCGKTTLLSVICGTLECDAGAVRVFDHDLSQMRDSALTRFRGEHVGFIFQQFNLVPSWTALENASVPLLITGADRSVAEGEAAKILAQVGLGERLGAYPRHLSGGQQQRVAIARALVHAPRLIICDEPTAALDAATGHHIVEMLKEQACRPDRCVIVVTHDSRIFHFADRIAEMEDGVVTKIHAGGEYHAQYV